MRLIIFGKNGQVGWELQRTLAPLGEVVALGKEDVDLADYRLLRQVISKFQPQVIVNAAAYNDVDKAEEEQDLAMVINGIAPGVMAEEAKAKGATLIHFSTDYVFDGEHGKPYSEDDTTRPLNIYGQSKLKGEQAIERVQGIYLIFRTGWVYSFRRGSFPVKVLRWARNQKVIRVVEDQVGSPTWCRMLAEMTALVLAMAAKKDSSWLNHRSGLYHLRLWHRGHRDAGRWESNGGPGSRDSSPGSTRPHPGAADAQEARGASRTRKSGGYKPGRGGEEGPEARGSSDHPRLAAGNSRSGCTGQDAIR